MFFGRSAAEAEHRFVTEGANRDVWARRTYGEPSRPPGLRYGLGTSTRTGSRSMIRLRPLGR